MTLLYSKDQAKKFFKALRAFSIEVMEHYGLPTHPHHKTRPWIGGKPKGVIEHFTAGVTWKGSIKWLNGGDNDAASCQFLILDRRVGEIDDIFSKPEYDILQDLPVLVLMLSDLDKACWHAGWVNGLCVGIENRNAGPLQGEQGAWTWWPKGWTAPFPHEGLGKTPINMDNKWWEPYSYGQVVANIILCQYLLCLYPDMDPRWFLPHSAVASTKYDTGRAFPLNKVRDAVFAQSYLGDLIWLHDFKADPMYMDDYDEDEDVEFLQEMALRQADRGEEEMPEGWHLADVPPAADLQALIDDGNWKDELGAIRRGLDKLGYKVPASPAKTLDNDTAAAVYIFQRSMGLKTDKVPGGKTQTAMAKRLKQFGLM